MNVSRKRGDNPEVRDVNAVYRPLVDRHTIKFTQGETLIGERHEVVLSQEEIYRRIFTGQNVSSG